MHDWKSKCYLLCHWVWGVKVCCWMGFIKRFVLYGKKWCVYPHSTYCILLFCSAVICSSHFLQVEENVINHFYHMICVCLYGRTSDVCCRRPQMRKQWCTIKTWLASNLHPSSSNIHIEDKHRPLHQSSHAAFCEWTLRIGPTFLKAI